MAVSGWLLDKSATSRAGHPAVGAALDELAGTLHLCPTALLEQLYSTRSAREYDETESALRAGLLVVAAPAEVRPLTTRRLA